MSVEEILYYADRLGKDKPEVKRMVQTAVMHPEQAHVVKRHMQLELKKKGYDLTDLPVFSLNLPDSIPEDGIFLGNIPLGNGTERKGYLPVESYATHGLYCGMSGSGKSTLVKFSVPQFVSREVYPVIFDQEDEYSVLLKILNPEEIYILDRNTDKDNLFEPPPGVDPKVWLAKVLSFLREALYLREGSINLLDMILTNLYRNRGVFDGGRNYPTILDVINFLDTMEYRPGTRSYMYMESLINRFKGGLQNELGDVLICRHGLNLENKQKKCVIYRMKGLSDPMRNFYIYQKMMKELAYRENLPPAGLKRIFVIDEAHKLYNREIARRYDLGEPMIFSNARTFAKRGIGCIYLDQVPSELPPALFGNVNNLFVLRMVHGRSVSLISQTMNLHYEQKEQISVLPPRHCILQSGEFPEPILLRIPEIRYDHVSEEEVKQHMEDILPELEYTPVVERLEITSDRANGMPEMPGAKRTRKQSKPNRIWNDILKLLAEVLFITLSALYKNLDDIAPWYARKITREMVRQDLIDLCPVNLGRKGNPPTYAILKPKGAEFIGVDYEDARLRGKGSAEHVILQNLLAEAMKDTGKTVMVEHSVNGKSVDIAEVSEDKSVAFEIELSPAHPHVIENICGDIEAGFNEVVIVTRNQLAMNEAKNNIYKNIQWESLSRVRFMLLREFL